LSKKPFVLILHVMFSTLNLSVHISKPQATWQNLPVIGPTVSHLFWKLRGKNERKLLYPCYYFVFKH